MNVCEVVVEEKQEKEEGQEVKREEGRERFICFWEETLEAAGVHAARCVAPGYTSYSTRSKCTILAALLRYTRHH